MISYFHIVQGSSPYNLVSAFRFFSKENSHTTLQSSKLPVIAIWSNTQAAQTCCRYLANEGINDELLNSTSHNNLIKLLSFWVCNHFLKRLCKFSITYWLSESAPVQASGNKVIAANAAKTSLVFTKRETLYQLL